MPPNKRKTQNQGDLCAGCSELRMTRCKQAGNRQLDRQQAGRQGRGKNWGLGIGCDSKRINLSALTLILCVVTEPWDDT